jgi:hypothetical protein
MMPPAGVTGPLTKEGCLETEPEKVIRSPPEVRGTCIPGHRKQQGTGKGGSVLWKVMPPIC